MKRSRDDDDVMDIYDTPNVVDEQKRLFEESFKRRRMQASALQNTAFSTQKLFPSSSASVTVQACYEELNRLLEDLEVDRDTREGSGQLLEHVISERERTHSGVR